MESYFPATSEALGLSPKKKKPEPEPEPEKSAVTAYVLKLKEVMKNAYEKRTRREVIYAFAFACLLYTSPSPRDKRQSRMPSSA